MAVGKVSSANFQMARKTLTQRSAYPDHPFFAWLMLVGVFCPTLPIPIGDLTFTAGRLVIFLLLVPALVTLFRRDRARVSSDYFAFVGASWMLVATAFNDGFKPYVAAEALEFLGAYLIGRAFFVGRPAVETFVRVFKAIVVIVILLALLDTVSGRDVTRELGLTQTLFTGISIWIGASLFRIRWSRVIWNFLRRSRGNFPLLGGYLASPVRLVWLRYVRCCPVALLRSLSRPNDYRGSLFV